jgi:hypothetical protein
MSLTAHYAGRCLERNFNVSLVNLAFQWDINVVAQLAQTPFVNFTVAIDKHIAKSGSGGNGLHGGGHAGVGGEVRAIHPLLLGYFHPLFLERGLTLYER